MQRVVRITTRSKSPPIIGLAEVHRVRCEMGSNKSGPKGHGFDSALVGGVPRLPKGFSNSKHEIRSTKQFQMTKTCSWLDQVPRELRLIKATSTFERVIYIPFVGHWDIRALNLFRISKFGFRIFDLSAAPFTA